MLDKVYRYFTRIINLIFFFWYPNFFYLFKHKVYLGRNIRYNQYFKLRGVGEIIIYDNCSFGYKMGGGHRGGSIEIQARTKCSSVKIGKNVSTNNNLFICASGSIKIGNDTLIGQGVTIMDFEAHGINSSERSAIGEIGSIDIGENVWIGSNVIILKNTSIGRNSVIAAGAVVKGNYPNNVIIGGVPAKIIKMLKS
jgi:acetyltransferase-like isoleucine patch superfamily enzyme